MDEALNESGAAMKVLILGAAGMIGRKLANAVATRGAIGGRRVDQMILADVVEPAAPTGNVAEVRTLALDVAEPDVFAPLLADRPDVIVHLAAVVSGEAEADFAKGYAVNLDGTRSLFDAIRLEHERVPGYCPRTVFASSIAVFGAPFPAVIPDDFALCPLTSYGAQKAIGELILADYTRRGFLDGVGLRLPTICIRPGLPNKAASGFFSNILREPLAGKPAVLPVSDDVRHFFASPRAAVNFFLHAAHMDTAPIGPRRNLNMPGLSATVAEEIEALREAAGNDAVALIRREPDETIARIVSGWATDVEAERARDLGFRAETSFREIVEAHIEDELGGKVG